MSDTLTQLASAVIEGDIGIMEDLTNKALETGLSAEGLLNEGLMPGMNHVGVEFRAGNMFVPEVLRSAKAMQASMNILKPLLAEAEAKMAGKVLLGTVKGDLHDIGKNLVGMMCEGAGFEVIDLGKDVQPQTFVDAIKEHKPEVLGMSALLTTTMRSMEGTIQALEEAGLREQVRIMVGGAPVTQSFSDQIGADGYASNASSAAEMAKRFVNAS